mgnify:FL=1
MQVTDVEYVKNTVVKYLESNDASVLPALFSALHLSQHDIARVQAGQSRGVLSWFS